jgi:rhodanese-related sulfurtransferase
MSAAGSDPRDQNALPAVDVLAASTLPAGAVLLDVRESDEWADGHAPDAVHLPMSSIAIEDIPPGRPVYVICRSGNRSARVVEALLANDVECFNVEGGMIAWADAGLPVVR